MNVRIILDRLWRNAVRYRQEVRAQELADYNNFIGNFIVSQSSLHPAIGSRRAPGRKWSDDNG
jgi:hypothetical protein